jgi:type I restriction enzyme S subunit
MVSETIALHIPSTARPLPLGWIWARLDEVCVGIYDCPHSTPKIINSGPLIARSQDIREGVFRLKEAAHVSEETYLERIRRAEPRYGDLLYSREGTYFGIAAEVPPHTQVCLGQRMVLIRPSVDRLNFRFLRYWLNSPVLTAHVQGHRDGTVAERLNMPTICGLPIVVPPLTTQQAIAHVLGMLDDKIELNRRMNETLESIVQALFNSWFVDFDPVYAKMAGQQPFGIDADTAALFPASFQESPVGIVPNGWSVKKLGEIVEINPTRYLKRDELAPYLEMANMPTTSARAIDWQDREFTSGTKFMNGDVLIARITPCLENGKTAFVDFLSEGQVGWGSTEYLVFRSKPPLPLEYAYFLARTDGFRSFAIQNMTGSSGRQRVPAESFSSFWAIAPPDGIAKKFGETASLIMAAMKRNDEASKTLAEVRDALLPKLISGELPIQDADRWMEKYTGSDNLSAAVVED